MSQGKKKQEGSMEIEISADPQVAKGVYSNMARVTFSENEFTIGFVFNVDNEAHLVSRVIVSPEHMEELSEAIQKSLEEYKGALEYLLINPSCIHMRGWGRSKQ
jgi:hypothetical protein